MSTMRRPIAISGAHGRLGSSLVHSATQPIVGWHRPDLDLDRPDTFRTLLDRDQPQLVIHAAAMTDVEACAKEPKAAMKRNGQAVEELARLCRSREIDLVLISTNEVFDGDRTDGRGYSEDDEIRPRNAYGTSKAAGESAARSAFGHEPGLWIVRTAWVYGPPGKAFPEKIVAAADRLDPETPLSVVEDEFGSPTLAADLARGLYDLIDRTSGGTFHLVNGGTASRLDWATRTLRVLRPQRSIRPISRTQFVRASNPPSWAVLDTARAAESGVKLRPWDLAFDEYLGVQSKFS